MFYRTVFSLFHKQFPRICFLCIYKFSFVAAIKETEFMLLCEMRKRLCNGRWDMPQPKIKIWHSVHWLPKTRNVLKPNLRAVSELSKFGA